MDVKLLMGYLFELSWKSAGDDDEVDDDDDDKSSLRNRGECSRPPTRPSNWWGRWSGEGGVRTEDGQSPPGVRGGFVADHEGGIESGREG